MLSLILLRILKFCVIFKINLVLNGTELKNVKTKINNLISRPCFNFDYFSGLFKNIYFANPGIFKMNLTAKINLKIRKMLNLSF